MSDRVGSFPSAANSISAASSISIARSSHKNAATMEARVVIALPAFEDVEEAHVCSIVIQVQ